MFEYFAYGSNLHLQHLRAWLGRFVVAPEDVGRPRRATLSGYCLRTNYLSVSQGAGACNIEPAPGQIVEGVLLTITSAVRDALRLKEGYPRCYNEIEIELAVPSIGDPVRATTYLVTPEHRLPFDLPVTATYRRLILAGAREHRLSPAYQAYLRFALNPTSSENPSELPHISAA